mmetsp:Transcript_41209/g.113676  ORF Transcript_41209/g.113676 Transcript_41209/m.113676 type:complete len:219 (+) Transcript_41209:656-1312(+)
MVPTSRHLSEPTRQTKRTLPGATIMPSGALLRDTRQAARVRPSATRCHSLARAPALRWTRPTGCTGSHSTSVNTQPSRCVRRRRCASSRSASARKPPSRRTPLKWCGRQRPTAAVVLVLRSMWHCAKPLRTPRNGTLRKRTQRTWRAMPFSTFVRRWTPFTRWTTRRWQCETSSIVCERLMRSMGLASRPRSRMPYRIPTIAPPGYLSAQFAKGSASS